MSNITFTKNNNTERHLIEIVQISIDGSFQIFKEHSQLLRQKNPISKNLSGLKARWWS